MSYVAKAYYDTVATEYALTSDLPWAKLEAQLISYALGDCSGKRVLDLGGGSGLQARRAVDAGATVVDVVDISAGMLKIGKDVENRLDRKARINYLEADITLPFDFLNLEKSSYDIIIANWVLDNAGSLTDLEGMWQNIGAYVKPGGKFVGMRNTKLAMMNNPCDRKYGAVTDNVREIPGGYRYNVTLFSTPETRFEGSSMEVTLSGSTELHNKHGFGEVSVIPAEKTALVQNDPEFWADYLESPSFVGIVATATTK